MIWIIQIYFCVILLCNTRGEKADEDCDTLVSKLENAGKKTRELVRRPLMHSDLVTNSDLRQSLGRATEVDQSEMENIMTELRKDTTKYRKEAQTLIRYQLTFLLSSN